MKNGRQLLMLLVVGLSLVFLFLWLVGPRYGIDVQSTVQGVLLNEAETARVTASGIIHADALQVSTPLGGRVKAVYATPGDTVQAGQLLVELDTTLLDAQIAAASAAVEVARAGLRQAQAGARPGEISIAEAKLAQARTAVVVADQALEDAAAYLENPQLLQVQASAAYTQIASAEHRLNQANILRDAASFAQDRFYEARENEPIVVTRRGELQDLLGPAADYVPDDIINQIDMSYGDVIISNGQYRVSRTVDLPFAAHLTPNDYWQSWVGVNSAQAQLDGARAYAWATGQQAADPLEVRAQVEAARAALTRTEAQVDMAQAYVDGLKAGATPAQIAAVQAQVDRAEATLERLRVQRAQAEVRAPGAGVVVEQSIHPGEVAAPGVSLLTLVDLTDVTMVVYVQETDLGYVVPGGTLDVRIDAWPDRAFVGTVRHIADQAEFTPRNVSTREERVNLVFAVDVALDNITGVLKPGMTGEAILQ